MLPNSCADAKDFLLNTSAVRTVMGACRQLDPSPLFPQAPSQLHVLGIHCNVSQLVSSFIPFPSTVTFYAALNNGNGDVLWPPILYVTFGRGSLLFFSPFIYSPLEALL